MTCTRCGERPSTGTLIPMCDPCFDEWEASLLERSVAQGGGPVKISDGEAEMIQPGCTRGAAQKGLS